MHTTEELQAIVESAVTEIEIDRQPQMLYRPIRYGLGSGGKRMRPLLVLMGCEMFGGRVHEAIDCAMALEIFHNFTLLHDDIMDNSDLRRGVPTVHRKWNNNVAILSGDAMVILAYETLAKAPSCRIPTLLKIFNEVALNVCEGQQFDMEFESREEVSIQQYINMIRLKTSVLLAGALQMGAVCAGADPDDARLMYQVGENLGLMFQLRDDLLDTYGDPRVFGKKIGGDILSNKKTFLLITALEKADYSTQQHLRQLLADNTMEDEQKILSVRSLYDRLGVRSSAEQASEKHYHAALTALEKVNIPRESKQILKDYALELMLRVK